MLIAFCLLQAPARDVSLSPDKTGFDAIDPYLHFSYMISLLGAINAIVLIIHMTK